MKALCAIYHHHRHISPSVKPFGNRGVCIVCSRQILSILFPVKYKTKLVKRWDEMMVESSGCNVASFCLYLQNGIILFNNVVNYIVHTRLFTVVCYFYDNHNKLLERRLSRDLCTSLVFHALKDIYWQWTEVGLALGLGALDINSHYICNKACFVSEYNVRWERIRRIMMMIIQCQLASFFPTEKPTNNSQYFEKKALLCNTLC